jgi:DNA replication initiation complex subunit (GINS family)
MQASLKKQLEDHAAHLSDTESKFAVVDQRVYTDMEATISELKLQADDIGQRLYNVQIEQIKPLKEKNADFEDRIDKLIG